MKSLLKKPARRFEPKVALLVQLCQLFVEVELLREEFFLARGVLFACDSAVEVRVQEPLQLERNRGKGFFDSAFRGVSGLCFLFLPRVKLLHDGLMPGVGWRDTQQDVAELTRQRFFAHVGLRALIALLRAAIVMMPFLPLCGDAITAFAAAKQTQEWEELPMFAAWPASLAQNSLHGIEELF